MSLTRQETIAKLKVKSPQGEIGVSLVADLPKLVEKYSKLLIVDTDNLFHITVNMPMTHTTDVLNDEGLYEPLCLLDLPQQWLFVKRQFTISIASFYQWYEDLIIVPEKTMEGMIHFHCIARLKPGRQATDIQRMFWRMFDITLSNHNSASLVKRFKDVTKYMVHVDPVRDEGIIDYLFHKDKKDYELVMDLKDPNGTYAFKPLYLHVFDIQP